MENEDAVERIVNQVQSPGNYPYGEDTFKFKANPFIEKFPDPRIFSGYNQELERTVDAIRNHSNVFILGAFGTGKTAMARTICEALRRVDTYMPLFVDVQKGRYSKMMLSKMIKQTATEPDPYASEAKLFETLTTTFEKTYQKGKASVIFFDEVIDGSNQTLRQILHVVKDIHDWEPTMVFNGTVYMRDQLSKRIAPLMDRVGEYIHLNGLGIDDVVGLVNKRIRLSCIISDWNGGATCGNDCSTCTRPFTRDSIELVQDNINGFPRHLINEFKGVVEAAAKSNADVVDQDLAEEVVSSSIRSTVELLSGDDKRIVDHLFESGSSALGAIAGETEMTQHTARGVVQSLESQGLLRPILVGTGVKYALMPKVVKYVVGLRRA